ncbi:RHS repeat-associated core domain-containing protein [Arenimonas sp. MALMAid1274]|uniref:RHS repeat-associated core domain-containing protein n=1 Tax=Arenimonas sp. MALMAid1274 TaxID=3411630 RepID=UPI003B9F3BDC
MRHAWGWMWLLVAGLVQAQSPTGKAPWEEFDKRIKASQKVAPLGNNAFGDEVSLSNGALSFSATDVSIPGNSGLPVAFSRSYSVRDRRHTLTDAMLADWEVDVPNISGTFAKDWLAAGNGTNRCSSHAQPPLPAGSGGTLLEDFWSGTTLTIPGVGGGEMLALPDTPAKPHLRPTGTQWKWIAGSNIYVSCLSSVLNGAGNGAGEGYLAITPDGTKYWFNWMAQTYVPTLRRGGRSAPPETGIPAGTPLDVNILRRKNTLYATRVEDRFGNAVTYTYSNQWNEPGRLTRIKGEGADTRQIDITYNGQGHVATVTDGTRTWNYSYAATSPTSRRTLTTVTQPDGNAWAINFTAFTNAEILYSEVFQPGEIYRTCRMLEMPQNYAAQPVGTITHPAGAVGTFTVGIQEHGRSSVPLNCGNFSSQNDPNDDINLVPISYHAWSLASKQVSGPGLDTATWTYAYESLKSVHMYPGVTNLNPVCGPSGSPLYYPCFDPPCLSDACAGSATTTVLGPENERTRYTYGNTYRYDEGKLKKVETGTVASPTMRVVQNTYDLSMVEDKVYPKRYGMGRQVSYGSFTEEYHRPLLSTKTTVQGVDFVRTLNTFDDLARPLVETKASTITPAPGAASPNSRQETTVYRDNTASWVISQVERRYVNTTKVEETVFQGYDLPWKLYGAEGLLLQTLTFNTDGTIATAMDPHGNTTTVSNWHRGIPQNVLFADLTTLSATVNNLGWVTAVTQQINADTTPAYATTSYGYDVMGRVDLVTYPTGDAVAWAPTSISFVKVAGAEYGIAGGHWREIVSTGNARKETYFDGLWRPRLVREFDASNEAATRRVTVMDYDHEGRSIFTGYPVNSLASIHDPTPGIDTLYDALGRPTATHQDAELDLNPSLPGLEALVTVTNYLANFEVQTINPRQHATTTRFQAFDTPDTGAPVYITAPEGVTTTIVRNALGQPESVTRSGTWAGAGLSATRRYTYDAHRRLCKTIEPETGATVMAYDAVGNLAWSAAGLALANPSDAQCDLDRTAANLSGRRVDRVYDARNRLTHLMFPGHNGNQSWTYTADGKPSTVNTWNDGGISVLTNTYVYNNRRMLTGESIAQPGWYTWGLGYGYDANGSLASQSYPTGLVVTYAPNALGQATQAGTFATGVQYHPNGAIKQFTYGNGLVHTMTQNARQLPRRSTTSGAILDHVYDYDPSGNVTAITDLNDSGRSRWMAYDALDRLTEASSGMFGGSDFAHRFTYDALDNLRSWKHAGVKDYANYEYDSNNLLTGIRNTGGTLLHTINYDVQGNVSSKNGHSYTFDLGNRMRAGSGTSSESYRYDALGRRVQTTRAGGATTLWHYSQGGQLLFSSKLPVGGTQTTHENIYLGGSVVAIIDHDWPSNAVTALRYQHTDALGSPVAETDAAGALIAGSRTNYDPFGGVIGKTINGIGYTGHVMDAGTGLTYMQQRYYDPQIGRFLSVDPVTASSINGGNFNRYWYANNNPYKFTDPDGRFARIGCFLQIYCDASAPREEKKPEKPKSEPNCTADECINIPRETRGEWASQASENLTAASHTAAEEAGGMATGWAIGKVFGGVVKWAKFQRAVSKVDIKEHAFRSGSLRIPAAEQRAVGEAIRVDIARRGLPPPGGVIQQTISVNGQTYSYRAFGLPNGNTSVGTAVPGHFGRDISVAPP